MAVPRPAATRESDSLSHRLDSGAARAPKPLLPPLGISLDPPIPQPPIVPKAAERAFGFPIPDYYATSLHKWLFAPFGTGFLYVRRDRIPELWPLMASPENLDADIRKFEEVGTHPCPNYLAVGAALTFHEGIGPAGKEARLVYLRNLWAEELLREDRVRLHTSLKPGFAGRMANFAVDGVEPGRLAGWLWDRHRIIVSAIGHPDCPGLRISPSVYTTVEELERFVDAVRTAIRQGLA